MENLYYVERVRKVIDYLKNNPNTDLSLKKIATIAMFSEFHFHRIFKEVTGETLRRYVKRLRMEKAGACLANDHSVVLKELWTQLGYSTASHFSRDFRHFYGCSPSQYQKQQNATTKTKKSNRKHTLFRSDPSALTDR